MLKKALTEILWVIILTVLFGAVFLLASCSTEGAGFSNNGAYANQTLCQYKDARGNERWVTAPPSGKCR